MSRGNLIDCYQTCPDGWRDDGAFCRDAEYDRGAGYPWKFGDPLNDDALYSRCEADHGKGNCEGSVIVYPKCKEGYRVFTITICRPNSTPDCAALGFLPGNFDLSCAKRSIYRQVAEMVLKMMLVSVTKIVIMAMMELVQFVGGGGTLPDGLTVDLALPRTRQHVTGHSSIKFCRLDSSYLTLVP